MAIPDLPTTHRLVNHLKITHLSAGNVHASNLINEVFRFIIVQYLKTKKPDAPENLFLWLEQNLGKKNVDDSLTLFAREFPPISIYSGETSVSDFIRGTSEGIPHRQLLLEEMLILWLTTVNPAQKEIKKSLFDDTPLIEGSAYLKMVVRELQNI